MLTILDVNPTGYFSFGIHPTIKLHELGVTLLEGLNHDRNGSANGAGKTSIFNTITSILFDKNPTDYIGEAITNRLIGKSFGKVTFKDSAGTKWRVIATRKWRKTDKYPCVEVDSEPSEWHSYGERYSGTDVYLERWNGSIWVDERGTNIKAGDTRLDLKATRRKILQVIGISYQQFMNVAYLAQQQSLKFVNGTHKEKLEVISELSDIGAWDKRVSKVRERIREVDSEIDRLNNVLDGSKRAGISLVEPTQSDKDHIQHIISNTEQQISECDANINLIQLKINTWKSGVEKFDIEIADIESNIRKLVGGLNDLRNKLSECSREYLNATTLIKSTPAPQEILNMQMQASSLLGQAQARRVDGEQLLSGSGRCPRCRSFVTDDHLIRQREILTLEIRELEDKARIIKENTETALTNFNQQILERLDAAEIEFKSNKKTIEDEIAFMQSAIDIQSSALNEAKANKLGLGADPSHEMMRVTMNRMNLLGILSNAKANLQGWNDRYDKWQAYNKLLSDTRTQIDDLEIELKYLRAIDKAFGDKGIKAHKLGSILSSINKTVQQFADILTDGAIKVWVTPFREKTDGSMSTDMQIMVKEGDKEDVPYGLYSGGEKQQIVLAFIGAFWQVATSQGSGVNILLLDEIFGPLDELNAIGVFNYLDYMKVQGKSTVMVVTHDKNIKDQLNFDRKWLVEKRDHISKLITTDVSL